MRNLNLVVSSRRMLGSKRILLFRLRHVRGLATAISRRPSSRPGLPPPMDPRNHRMKKVMSLVSSEQLRLQNKHREELESNRAESLQEIVDHVEWRGVVYSQTPEKVARLLADSREDLTSLSDRQLAVLISTFGNACESVSYLRRSAFMSQALQALQQRGVSLQALSRNAVLAARIDNNESVNVIDELKAWEADGITPNEETYAHLSRVYAHSANTQGIVDIINHMKSNEMPISETLLESLIYSVARGGHYTQAEKFVQKFQSSANEALLRVAVARAAVARGEISEAFKALASIPMSAKLNQITNNKLVLELLYDMLDAGEMDAVEKLLPYLAMAQEGSTLSEFHANPSVLARSRRACAEGKLDVALKLYSLLHPKFKNSYFEATLLDSLGNRLRSNDCSVDSIFALAETMESMGLTKDHRLILLEKSINTPRTHEVFAKLTGDQVEQCLAERPALRKTLARRLSEQLTTSNLKREERVKILADIATVLFSYDKQQTIQDIMAAYSVIYVLGGKDVNLAIPALEVLENLHVHREYATALVQQLLRKGDPLAEEKLNKLLNSGAVRSINLSRIQKQVSGLLLNREKKTSEADERQLNLAARIIALSFPAENSKGKSIFASKYIILQLQSELLPIDRARKVYKVLEKEARIRLPAEDITAGKKALHDSGQKEKVQLLEMLRKKSQTYARWLSSSVDELEEELAHIRSMPDHKPAVANAIYEVILRKVSVEKPINYQVIVRHLLTINESFNPIPPRIAELARQMHSNAFVSALGEQKLDIAENLWDNRIGAPSVENTLTYIALLYLNGRQDKADKVCEDLRSSAQTITGASLQTVGDRLGDSFDISQMRQFSQYLQGKFNLASKHLLRIIACVRLRQLEKLISAGKLDEALQLVVEHTVESSSAFGQYQLAAAAIKAENMGVLKGVFDVVKRTHGKEVAFLDLAYVLLEERRTERAMKLLDTPQLKISPGKLEYFIRRAVDSNRPDVLRGLFAGLCQGDRASTVGLNKLLEQLCRLYYKDNDFTSLQTLHEEIERASFPLEHQLRTVFEQIHRRKIEAASQ
ncbi:unnamed protein product [Cylicocyclus nassatus]|uniref:Leucine-rich PPR motif-containing protein, mitochondrial n=1 Tax=Cylicocyclus nassatus TaxID=53992 RepID=A0AA36GGJ8_CYLNA|nr:unnamed protein product [Cylicocyclus nassatus]